MTRRMIAASGLLFVFAAASLAQTPPAGDEAKSAAVLDNTSFWRVLYSWARPPVKTADGFVDHKPKPGRGACKCEAELNFMTTYPPEGWTSPDFYDTAWARRPFFGKYVNGETDHRAGGGAASPNTRLLSLRGKFQVQDPAKVSGLSLMVSYRGGVAVYVNGKELTRRHLPEGKLAPAAPAEIYEKDVYLREDGKPQLWFPPNPEAAAAFAKRERKLEALAVPAELLRKGLNVLAVEIHAAAYPEEYEKVGFPWSTCGLIELHLRADKADGLTPNVVRPAGLQVWNTNIAAHLYDFEYGDPSEPLQPISLAGPRNGVVTGRVAVGSDQAIKGLTASITELTGPGGKSIPAAGVQLAYGKFDGLRGSRWGGALPYHEFITGPIQSTPPRDDALLEAPPAETPVAPRRFDEKARAATGLPPHVPGAVQPVYVQVRIPKDAAPGEYKGTLTINAAGQSPVQAPVQLTVIDWALSDPAGFDAFLGLIQSPEGVALNYGVPLFSDKHLELMGRSFELIGQTGGRVLVLTLGAESQYGNAESLVLWVKDADGKLTHDFSRVEKYVDLALKKMGKPQFVVCGVWDSCMHVSAPQASKRKFPRHSVLDKASGKIENADGPANGSPESEAFWRPVLTGVKDILAKRGLDDRMLLGYSADVLPDKATIEVFHKIVPGAGWQSTRHGPTGCESLPGESAGVPVKYHANVWGGWDHHDPDCRRIYGWRHPVNPSYRTWLDRDLFDASTITWFRTALEQAIIADRHGLGQIGADFWPVKGVDGKPTHTMVGRFPATSEGNLGIYAGQLLYPGPSGPVPTLRFEMMRENLQECEAKIFLEKLLTAKPCPLPEDLAKKCQGVLDERMRWHRVRTVSGESALFWPYTGAQARGAALFEAAAQAAKVSPAK